MLNSLFVTHPVAMMLPAVLNVVTSLVMGRLTMVVAALLPINILKLAHIHFNILYQIVVGRGLFHRQSMSSACPKPSPKSNLIQHHHANLSLFVCRVGEWSISAARHLKIQVPTFGVRLLQRVSHGLLERILLRP